MRLDQSVFRLQLQRLYLYLGNQTHVYLYPNNHETFSSSSLPSSDPQEWHGGNKVVPTVAWKVNLDQAVQQLMVVSLRKTTQ